MDSYLGIYWRGKTFSGDNRYAWLINITNPFLLLGFFLIGHFAFGLFPLASVWQLSLFGLTFAGTIHASLYPILNRGHDLTTQESQIRSHAISKRFFSLAWPFLFIVTFPNLWTMSPWFWYLAPLNAITLWYLPNKKGFYKHLSRSFYEQLRTSQVIGLLFFIYPAITEIALMVHPVFYVGFFIAFAMGIFYVAANFYHDFKQPEPAYSKIKQLFKQALYLLPGLIFFSYDLTFFYETTATVLSIAPWLTIPLLIEAAIGLYYLGTPKPRHYTTKTPPPLTKFESNPQMSPMFSSLLVPGFPPREKGASPEKGRSGSVGARDSTSDSDTENMEEEGIRDSAALDPFAPFPPGPPICSGPRDLRPTGEEEYSLSDRALSPESSSPPLNPTVVAHGSSSFTGVHPRNNRGSTALPTSFYEIGEDSSPLISSHGRGGASILRQLPPLLPLPDSPPSAFATATTNKFGTLPPQGPPRPAFATGVASVSRLLSTDTQSSQPGGPSTSRAMAPVAAVYIPSFANGTAFSSVKRPFAMQPGSAASSASRRFGSSSLGWKKSD